MSKGSNVFYKLPFEDLRGKLAIKQTDIKYSGQRDTEAAFDLPTGKHQAVNYDSCIVLSKRRGSNRFYVKKNTTINITRRAQVNKAILGICASLTARMAKMIIADLDSGNDDYADLYAAYEYYANGKTFREWLTSIVYNGVISQDTLFEYDEVPDPDTGEIQTVAFAGNPFRSASLDIQVDGGSITYGYTYENWAEKQVYQKFYKTLATLWQPANTQVIKIIRKDLAEYELSILFQTAADGSKTVQDYISSIQGNAFWAFLGQDEQQQDIYGAVIYRSDGRLWAKGQLFTDEARTTPLDPSAALDTLTTLYLK